MRQVVEKFAKAALQGGSEKFGGARSMGADYSMTDALSTLISFIVVYAILLFIGKFLWNEYLVKYVTIFKPIPGVIELIAISVLVRLFLA
jgi:hypothetical protein